MFCPGCGKDVSDADAFCRHCGRSLSGSISGSPESAQKAGSAPTAMPAQPPIKRSGEATASLILGLFSFIPVIGLIAVIFGHMAKASIRRSGGRLLGDGMASFGLFLGYLALGGWVIYGLSIVVHPILPSTQRAENRTAVIGELRMINTANVTYSVTYGHGFAPTLAALGPPKGSQPTAADIGNPDRPDAAGLIDSVLASGTIFGYRFTYAARPKKHGDILTYTVHADPLTHDETWHYFTDFTGVIRQEQGKEANFESMSIIDEPSQ